MAKFDFSLKPNESIKYLRSKGYKLSFNYSEIEKQAHHKAFTVAKVTRLDILHDIFNALDTALNEGKSFKEFQKELKPTLQKKGWYGKKDIVNEKTGEVKTIKVDTHRLRRIFKTNMRVAYMIQRHQQMKELPNSVYWRYTSALLENTRDNHRAAHGTTLHKDHSWWDINYPPNGWGCVCKIRAYSKKQLEKKNIKIQSRASEDIASKDWNYNPAKTDNLSKPSKINLDSSLINLAPIVKNDSYKELNEDQVKEKFFKDMNLVPGETYIDKVNDPIVLDESLFKSLNFSKGTKRDRHLYMDEFAKLIKDPDEIYLEFENLRNESDKYHDKNSRLVKKYMKYYKTSNGAKKALMGLFEYQKDKTLGVSLYFIDSSGTVEKKRVEKLIYQRD